MSAPRSSYDAIPYQSRPFRESRPERMQAVAALFGLASAPPERARVLEIGCSMGGNLLPMAVDNPGAQFLGIDASSRQIAEGWKAVERLGLKNLELRQLDILEVERDLGEFDYIVSHGVFSWVPPRVQAKMLEICQRHLAPNGVAYISYNTYPGWHIRGIVRDMMLYRGMQFADPAARLAQAKSLVGFVAQAIRASDTPYQRLLQNELNQMAHMEDYYLHHDHLEEHNEPVYFHEFARRLAVNGLQYLGEADFSMMVSTNFSPEVAKTLHELGAHDILQMEQYMDFVRCRYFRKTLVCRASVRLNRMLTPAVVKGLWLASNAAPAGELALEAGTAVTFTTPGGDSINCRSPLTKIALRTLASRWPMPVRFEELAAHSMAEAKRAGIAFDEAGAERFLAGEALTCMASGVAEWRLAPAPFTTEVNARPATTPLARMEADQGYRVTSLRGDSVTLDEFHRQVLRLLDGSRSREALGEALTDMCRRGELLLHREGPDKSPVRDEAEMRGLLGPALDKALDNLAKKALLRRAAP
jgi:methyltransferase-like protein/cyclopropane fatty-acyl-phospholipid synthase-like methyltransferase